MILWVDIETTGLDPVTDYLLEVGMALTTDDLHPINSVSIVVKPAIPLEHVPMDDVVKSMHEANNLFDDVRNGGVDVFAAEDYLVRWLKHAGIDKGQLPMAGSSVAFDRAFLKRHMPLVENWFHYRSIDVSTIKELAKRWDGKMPTRNGSASHRALDDIQASIDELTHYRETGFIAQPNNNGEIPGQETLL